MTSQQSDDLKQGPFQDAPAAHAEENGASRGSDEQSVNETTQQGTRAGVSKTAEPNPSSAHDGETRKDEGSRGVSYKRQGASNTSQPQTTTGPSGQGDLDPAPQAAEDERSRTASDEQGTRLANEPEVVDETPEKHATRPSRADHSESTTSGGLAAAGDLSPILDPTQPANPANSPTEDVAATARQTVPPPTFDAWQQESQDQVRKLAQPLNSLDHRMNDFNQSLTLLTEHFDKLHTETQKMRQGEIKQTLLPMLRLLLTVLDTIDQLKVAALHEHELMALDHVASELADILQTWGVEEDTPYEGEVFNMDRHNGVAVATTDDPSQDRKIARIVRRGFTYGGTMLRRTEAEVYRFTIVEDQSPRLERQ